MVSLEPFKEGKIPLLLLERGAVVVEVLVGAVASHSSSSCESGVRIMGSDAVFTVHI